MRPYFFVGSGFGFGGGGNFPFGASPSPPRWTLGSGTLGGTVGPFWFVIVSSLP